AQLSSHRTGWPAGPALPAGATQRARKTRSAGPPQHARPAPPDRPAPPARTGQPSPAALQRRALSTLSALVPAALELGELFRAAGHELALVGGPVRDAFLGRVSTDLDFATSATPEQTERLLAAWGDTHWDIGREFGTIGALRRTPGEGSGEVVVEVTTYRSDRYDPASRKPEV